MTFPIKKPNNKTLTLDQVTRRIPPVVVEGRYEWDELRSDESGGISFKKADITSQGFKNLHIDVILILQRSLEAPRTNFPDSQIFMQY